MFDDSIYLKFFQQIQLQYLSIAWEIKDGSVKRELATWLLNKKVAIEEEMSANEALDTIQGELYKISKRFKINFWTKRYKTGNHQWHFSYRKNEKLGNKQLIYQNQQVWFALNKRTTGFNEGILNFFIAEWRWGKLHLF